MDLMSTAQLLGNLGEFVGAIAVVVTLAFLVVQIGHSAKSTGVATVQSVFQEFDAINRSLAVNLEAAMALDAALNRRGSLTAEQQFSAFASVRSYTNCLYLLYTLKSLGAAERELWQSGLRSIAPMLRSPGGRSWLEKAGTEYPPGFTEELLSEMGEEVVPYDTSF